MVSNELNFDDILDDLGQFGWYQILTFLLVSFPIIFNSLYNAQYVFTAANISYRCSVPECESSPPEWDTGEWGAWALPDARRRRCERWAPSDVEGPCTPENFNNSTAIPCTQWVYHENNTIIAEFELACREWKWTLVGSIHNCGVFFALPLTGYVSDRFGRRIALVTTAVSSGVMGLVRSFSTSYGMYLAFEFLDAFLGSGSYHAGYILVMETVGLNKRVICGNLIWSTFAVGQSLVAVAAWAVPSWRTLTRIIYTPSLFFIVYHFLLDESVRWLLHKGKKEQAIKIIYKIAAFNKKEPSSVTMKILNENSKEDDQIVTNKSESVRCRSLLLRLLDSRVILFRLLICSFWWICVTFIYYGLSINSVSLIGHSYMVYILTTLVEIPGNIISVLTLDRFGRKSTIMVGLLVCGVSLITTAFINNENAVVGLSMLGMLCTSMVFSSLYIYTTELFPTEGRSSLVALCSMVGRVGSITAPQTPLLMAIVPWLPYAIFGALSISAGALMVLTPETLNVRLPDTIEQAEIMAVAPRNRSHTDIIKI